MLHDIELLLRRKPLIFYTLEQFLFKGNRIDMDQYIYIERNTVLVIRKSFSYIIIELYKNIVVIVLIKLLK